MIDDLGVPPWGAIALVSYVPDPLRSVVAEIRQLLPGDDDPEPHITILPPRPLRQSVHAASTAIRATLERFEPFDVELSHVRRFPETNFIYLDIGNGNTVIRELHAALNDGGLHDAERFEFRPHLTLGGPFEIEDVADAQRTADLAWRGRRVTSWVPIENLVCLWMPPHSRWRDWRRVWSHQLAGAARNPPRQMVASALTTQTY